MAEYERTHPWISFKADLKPAPPALWLALGEARSKCEHLAGVPLKPSVAQYLHQVYLAKGVLATTAIEGNTLTEKEALAIVQEKSELPKSQEYLEREITNILKAANLIVEQIEQRGPHEITVEEIKTYNKLVLDGLELEPYVEPGEFVKVDIAVAGYHGAPWQECPMLVEKLCRWLNSKDFKHKDDDEITYGILKAMVSHLYLVWIHPFGDGNGRTARLMEVRFLTEAGVPSSAAHLLSNFYNRTRNDYYRRLREASKTDRGFIDFLMYAANGFVEGLKEQLARVKFHQWHVSWQNFVHEQFSGKNSVSERRQLRLVLALSEQSNPVPKPELRRLTPQLAELYASKTNKTLTRDIHALEEMKLIESAEGGYRSTMEQILAFLPRVRKGAIAAQVREAVALLGAEEQLPLDL